MYRWIALLAIVLVGTASLAGASKQIIPIGSNDVTTYTPSDTTLGKYYTLTCRLPQGLTVRGLERAVLELYVKAAAIDGDSLVGNTPLLEVYALKSGFTGGVDVSSFETPSIAVKPVSTGNSRRVLLDVTQIIKSYLSQPSKNHGLIVGSLTGERAGDFTLKTGMLPDGRVAQIRLYVDPRR